MEKRIYRGHQLVVFTDVPPTNEEHCITGFHNTYELNQQIDTQLDQSDAAIIYHPDIQPLFNEWQQQFKVLEAAGGLIKNENHQFLFIKRLGKWDLPKGKMEPGEQEAETAAREIREETGADHLINKGKIIDTYHTYHLNGQEILKVSHWFLFDSLVNQSLTPQTEEDITAVRWFSNDELEIVLQDTYENIKQVLKAAGLVSF